MSQLSTINGEYLFSLISDTGDGATFSWRARFIPDTSALLYLDLGKISPDKRDLIIKQAELAFKRRDHSIPIFEVLDPKTGERRQYADAGNYVQSAGRMFGSKSGITQLDGSGYFIDIRAVEKGAVFGMWRAFSFGVRVGRDGFIIPEPSGHFCGRRVDSAQ